MDYIPVTFKPLRNRLERTCPDLTRQQLHSIVLVIRLADILHQSFCASFLTLSLTSKLCTHLGIPELLLELEVFVLRWSFREGAIAATHRITFDYDMHSCYDMTRIARDILKDSITVEEGLQRIQVHCTRQNYSRLEKFYDTFPGRALIIPLMAATCATVFFDGTWYDFGFGAVCGLAAGIVASVCNAFSPKELLSIMDYIVAIVVALVATASVYAFPQNACFISQVLGTLYWFFYGTAFVLSIYEATNNQLVVGITRFFQASLRSYGLAFGAIIGGWLSFYVTDHEELLTPCSEKSSQIEDLWFILLFPLAGIACLLQFRVSLVHFPMCLTVQVIAYGSQYLIGTVWRQPDFITNVIAAFLATISSSAVCKLGHLYNSWRLAESKEEESASVHGESNVPTEPCTPQMDEVQESLENGVASEYSTSPVSYDDTNPRNPSSMELDESGQLPEMSSGEPRRRRREAHFRPTGPSSNHEVQDSDTFGFVNASMGYVSNTDDDTFMKSDIWYCLMPAIYLLVPGAKVFQTAFSDLLLDSIPKNNPEADDYAGLGFSLLVIAFGQVLGLRFGFTTLWLFNAAKSRLRRR